jgi:hypothetical protein
LEGVYRCYEGLLVVYVFWFVVIVVEEKAWLGAVMDLVVGCVGLGVVIAQMISFVGGKEGTT